jgi:hypothetical protein
MKNPQACLNMAIKNSNNNQSDGDSNYDFNCDEINSS